MIIIGEKINATRKEVKEALVKKDADLIADLARTQAAAGAHFLDINGGDPEKELEYVGWLIDIVQNTVELPLCIDSANAEVFKNVLGKVKKKPIINSITLECDRLRDLLPIIKSSDCYVIGLLMSDDGLPVGVEDRINRADKLIEILKDAGKSDEEIFIDPCFLAIYTEQNAGLDILEAIREIRKKYPDIHISGGISNASYGMPVRKWINMAYTILAMGSGLDAAIIDPTVPGTKELILAAEVILAKDPMGMNYITEIKEKI